MIYSNNDDSVRNNGNLVDILLDDPSCPLFSGRIGI